MYDPATHHTVMLVKGNHNWFLHEDRRCRLVFRESREGAVEYGEAEAMGMANYFVKLGRVPFEGKILPVDSFIVTLG